MTYILLILVTVSLIGLYMGFTKDSAKWRVVGNMANTIMMVTLAAITLARGDIIWSLVCLAFSIIDSWILAHELCNIQYSDEDERVSRESVDDTKRVLTEFIKEIEEYGSRRH